MISARWKLSLLSQTTKHSVPSKKKKIDSTQISSLLSSFMHRKHLYPSESNFNWQYTWSATTIWKLLPSTQIKSTKPHIEDKIVWWIEWKIVYAAFNRAPPRHGNLTPHIQRNTKKENGSMLRIGWWSYMIPSKMHTCM